jgi:hypothetical protein
MSVFNFFCQNKIFVIPYPLNKDNGINKFKFSSTTKGHAVSSFGVIYGSDGLKRKFNYSYLTRGYRLDTLLEKKLLLSHPGKN